jgi:hypothetical protein
MKPRCFINPAAGRDDCTTVQLRDGVRLWVMGTSKHRPTSALRRALDAANSDVGDPALAVLSYIPKRRIRAAGTVPRDLTLQAGFIPPCLPMTAPGAPSGRLWLHEVKHDGLRIIARKDGARVRLYGLSGNDLTQRYPLIVEGMARLPSCTIDGEAIACDESGIASFDLLQRRERDECVFLYAFDLIELAARIGAAMRLHTAGSISADCLLIPGPGCWPMNGSTAANATAQQSLRTHARSGSKASCRSARTRGISRGDRRIGSR